MSISSSGLGTANKLMADSRKPMLRAKDYLRIPSAYARVLGGLSWSARGEAVRFEHGGTLALAAEIALFLEGFASVRRLIPFAHVLHLLELFGTTGEASTPQRQNLRRRLENMIRPTRNVGVLCGHLCAEVPAAEDQVDLRELSLLLLNPQLMVEVCLTWLSNKDTLFLMPILPANAFEKHVLAQVERLSDRDLAHWLRHGQQRVRKQGKKVAEQVVLDKPKTLAGIFAEVLRRDRLAGASPYLGHFLSALSLPPRRLERQELPIGGYSDVTTRGNPEQLLPSQFAVDNDEFVRRFAAHELLYFRREDPRQEIKHDLVVIVDQGVRTWGEARLFICAASVALGQWTERYRIPFLMTTTGQNGKLIDPRNADGEQLAEMLEASDLSADPGLTLEQVLEQTKEPGRDIILVTHPRNVTESNVADASFRVPNETRLFTVAIDARGRVEFARMLRGSTIPINQFKVEKLQTASPRRAPADDSSWVGDIEPIGFPFKIGVTNKIRDRCLAFSHDGSWLMTVSDLGMVHIWKRDGSDFEVLPRAFMLGDVMKQVDRVLGVHGGFAVCGNMNSPHTYQCVAHYDLVERNVQCYSLGRGESTPSAWFYSPAHHSVVFRHEDREVAVDLSSGGVSARSKLALELKRDPTTLNSIVHKERTSSSFIHIDGHVGAILGGSWDPFIPTSDGKPVLLKKNIFAANCFGDVVVIDLEDAQRLIAVDVRQEALLLDATYHGGRGNYACSPDGHWLARQTTARQVLLHDLTRRDSIAMVTRVGHSHNNLDLTLGRGGMEIRIGTIRHSILWELGRLEIVRGENPTLANPHGLVERTPEQVRYDEQRFHRCALGQLVAVVDAFGHICMFSAGQLICMFFVFRNNVAAWLPDGTCFGPETLLGRPASADAQEKIGQALLDAERGMEKDQ